MSEASGGAEVMRDDQCVATPTTFGARVLTAMRGGDH